ncbi:fimbria/pilus periplasmic chaperone [Achromobacter sp. ESBL13]|uniref:fimbria/pilus periplasmic chaperone n=1 Tax=Achromobacter sp. ESBL13 TaxID=3077328 RepID=UPI002FC72840
MIRQRAWSRWRLVRAFGLALALALTAALTMVCHRVAYADLIVTGTRFIYPATQQSLTLHTANIGQHPVLVQSWLDTGDFTSDPSLQTVPFLLTPPVYRLDAGQRASLLLRYTGERLPQDRESVFWINFLEVPARDPVQNNLLQLSYRLRMKVLYRPEGLPGSALDAIANVAWTYHAADHEIEAFNAAPYVVSLARLELDAKEKPGTFITLMGLTVAPLSRTRFPLPKGETPRAGKGALRYQAANDDGDIIEGTRPLGLQ